MVYEVISKEMRRPAGDTNGMVRVDIQNIERQLTKIHTALTGLHGDNGIIGEIKALRDRMHGVEGAIGVASGISGVLAQRVADGERDLRDVDGTYRRHEWPK